MGDLIWLSDAQMRRIEPYFPLSHGVPRFDDRRVVFALICPQETGPFLIRVFCAKFSWLRGSC